MDVICVLCPKGCLLGISERDGEITVTGNGCPRGVQFGNEEWKFPKRMLCTTLKTNDQKSPRLSVRTSASIPKDEVMHVMDALKNTTVNLPIECGAVILEDILNLGVDILATQTMKGG